MFPFIKSAFFQNLLNGFSNGVVIFNTAGRIYAVNQAAADILGFDLEPCTAMNWEELFSGVAIKDEFAEFIQHAMDSEHPQTFPLNTRYVRPDGDLRQLTLTKSVLVDYGKTFGILVEINDVSHIYAMHEREKRIMEEKNLVQRERAESLQKLSMAVAHQIRNPLTMIGGFAGIMLKKVQTNSSDETYLKTIIDGGHRLEEIVAAVSEYTAMGMGELTATPLAALVEKARDTVRRIDPENYEKVAWGLKLNGARINADPHLMTKAISEILLNSLESFHGARGKITISSPNHNGDESILLVIEDNGSGIPSDVKPYIFDPFSTTKTIGVGMGLCVAERIVGEHGGSIRVDSSEDQGTQVTLEFRGKDHPTDEEEDPSQKDEEHS